MSTLCSWTYGYKMDLKWRSLERPVLSGMHLICLGIMRKLLNLWLHGGVQYRIQYKVVDEISTRLITNLRPSIPIEFARKPRRLDCIKLWKATEYRLILLYTGP